MRCKRRSFLALFSILLVLPGLAGAGAIQEGNQGRGGETLNFKTLLVRGRTTVLEFYSPFCPPCHQLAPLLEQLAQKRPDLAIIKININRPQVQGIDWRSPLAQQYRLRSVPYFVIFNPKGKLMAEGKAATSRVLSWLREARILEK